MPKQQQQKKNEDERTLCFGCSLLVVGTVKEMPFPSPSPHQDKPWSLSCCERKLRTRSILMMMIQKETKKKNVEERMREAGVGRDAHRG